MAANLKIGIIADDNGAQKKLEGLSTSVDLTAKSVDQLRNKMAQLTVENVKLTSDIGNMVQGSKDWIQATRELKHIQETLATTTKQYDNAVQRLGLSYQTGTDSLKAYKQELKMLQSQYQKAAAQGQGTGFSSGDMQNLELITSKIEEVTKKIEELEKTERNEAEQRAKNNSLTQLQNSIDQANIQGILEKQKALKEFTNTLSKANLQQQQYNAQAVNNFTSGTMSTASAQTTDYLAQGMLGNTINQLKSDYEAYYQQLLKVIAAYGTESKEAKTLAARLNELDGKMQNLSTSTTSTTTRIKNLVKNFVSAQLIVYAIKKLITSVVNTLKESAAAAAEAEETYNLFITTFENAAITAEQVSSRLANSLGIANSTAQETLGTFGDLAAGYGATDKEALEFAETATEVAMDIVSYKNISGDLSTTMQSLSSGLAGNVENFRKLGYVMTQAEVKAKLQEKGLDKLTGSALQYAQIQARLEILQEKSVKAQGDMIKTLDSTTNVTRRLNESWLEWKENLGESVNNVLTPMKRWLNEILTISNKVTSAMKEINGGEFTVKVEQVAEGEQLDSIINKLAAQIGDTMAGRRYVLGVDSSEGSYLTGREIADIALSVGTDIERVIQTVEADTFHITEEAKKTAQEIYRKEKADAEKRQKKEDAKNEALSAIQSAMSFIDNLNSINGVYGNDSILSQRLENTQNGVTNNTSLEGDTQAVVNNLLANLSSASADSFVSALDIALGREDTESMLEAKLASVEEVYEALWNEFYSSGEELTEWQKGALEKTLELAKSLNGQIEDLNKEDVKVFAKISNASKEYISISSLLSSLQSAQSAASSNYSLGTMNYESYYSLNRNLGVLISRAEDVLDNGLLGETAKDFIEQLTSDANFVIGASNLGTFNSSDPYSFLTDIQKATGENTLLDALEAQLSAAEEYYENVKTFYKADGVISEEEQTALNDILAMVTGIYEKKEKEANKEEPEEGVDASSLLGEWATLAENPLQWLIDLLAQTEAVQKFGTLLSDSILPALNACLEPMLPALEMVGSLIQNLVLPALEILFPVIKQIAYVITWVAGSVNVAIGLISDTVKYVVGNMVYGITETLNKAFGWLGVDIDNKWAKDWSNINILGNAQSRIDEMNEHLAEIDKMSMQIEKNTSEDEMDLTVLNDLFSAGILSRDEMNALRASYLGQADPGKQTQLLASTAGDYATYLRSGGTSNVSYGDVSIEINSESGDPEKIAKEVARVLEEWQRNGKKSFSVAIA